MPALKLTYFDLRARAEPARLLLAQAGVSYEDHRLPPPFTPEAISAWQKVKPDYPFGVLPVLQVDNETICQSMAVARYVANAHGLGGKTPLATAQMDEIVDALSEATEKQYNAFLFEKDEAKKTELQAAFSKTVGPTVLANIEKRLVARGGEYLVGGALSWADILLYHFVSELPDKAMADATPKVAALVARVGALPNIKKWVESRPESVV